MTRTNIIGLSIVLGLTVGVAARELVLIDEDFESGLGAWTQMEQPLPPPPTVFDDTPSLFPANGAGILGPNIGFLNSKSGGFAANLPAPDGTTVTWLQRQFPLIVAPGTKVILNLEVDRYVYTSTGSADYQYCNRIYVLTNALYDDPMFGCHGDDDGYDPVTTGDGARSSVWNHETGSGDKLGGKWRHTSWTDAANKVFTLNNGNLEIRLVQYERQGDGGFGDLNVAWDNLHIVLKDYTTKQVLWTWDEDFESYNSTTELMTVWTRMLRPAEDPDRPRNDTPLLFSPTDPLLHTNSGNPGSQSAGYSSDLAYTDPTLFEWIQQQFPAIVAPGTYPIHFECDRYVYKVSTVTDPWAVANRVYILTDSLYDNPEWNVGTADPDPQTTNEGFRRVIWNGDNGGIYNGVWTHDVFDGELTTTSGNIELRLLICDRFAGAQAVAWDNVKFSITVPCNAPRFDTNGDGDVDQADFAVLQSCYTGDSGVTADYCRCVKADADTDVDVLDLQAFENCASGPGVSADPTCDSTLPLP